MADCRIVNEKVINSIVAIQGLAKDYEQAGVDFETAFMKAIADMEGASKDAMVDFFNKNYSVFVTSMESGLPAMINGLADLLEGNRSNFETVDNQIAQTIRDGGQQG